MIAPQPGQAVQILRDKSCSSGGLSVTKSLVGVLALASFRDKEVTASTKQKPAECGVVKLSVFLTCEGKSLH